MNAYKNNDFCAQKTSEFSSELELIVNDTKCSVEDAVNYLSARTMFYRAVFFEEDKIKDYLKVYTEASNRIYSKKVIRLSPDGFYINNQQIQIKDKKE